MIILFPTFLLDFYLFYSYLYSFLKNFVNFNAWIIFFFLINIKFPYIYVKTIVKSKLNFHCFGKNFMSSVHAHIFNS